MGLGSGLNESEYSSQRDGPYILCPRHPAYHTLVLALGWGEASTATSSCPGVHSPVRALGWRLGGPWGLGSC